jgi:hypothetical protein
MIDLGSVASLRSRNHHLPLSFRCQPAVRLCATGSPGEPGSAVALGVTHAAKEPNMNKNIVLVVALALVGCSATFDMSLMPRDSGATYSGWLHGKGDGTGSAAARRLLSALRCLARAD